MIGTQAAEKAIVPAVTIEGAPITQETQRQSRWPGLAMTTVIATAAYALHQLPELSTFSPMILAIMIGIAIHNMVGTPARAKAGVAFSLKNVLRFAIILLGLQLTAAQVAEVGTLGVALIAVTLIGTFLFTVGLGRALGVEHRLVELLAAGTSICGASAIIATNSVTRAPDEDVVYAVASVTVFGCVSMFLYPLLPGVLHLDARAYGLWTGDSVHEIAQVVAATYQRGKAAGDFGTIAKLTRVMMLAPMVIGLGLFAAHRTKAAGQTSARKAKPMPYFVFGFVALVILNSLVNIPPGAKAAIVILTTFLLSMGLAAMGLETNVQKLKAKGLRPLILGAGAWLFISVFSLALVKLAG